MLALILAGAAAAHELGLTRATVTFAADRTYAIDILVDPESLLAKLEILAGRSPSGVVPIDELPPRIEALSSVLRDRVAILFDGERQTPALAYVPGPPADSTPLATTQPAAPLSGPPPTVAPPPAPTPVAPPPVAPPPVPTPPVAPPPVATSPRATPSSAPVPAASTATLRFSGTVPRGARQFQINYGLVLGAYALTIRNQSGAPPVTYWVVGGQASDPVDLTQGLVPMSRLAVAWQYFVLGFEHILPKGLDHILFVLGIFLLSPKWRPVLLQVTTFTIAHSITLGLTIYGVVSLSPAIVEPLIALSITYVAIENLFTSTLRPWRLALVFVFGLLHGMGFAGVLSELGLPRSEFLTALLTFNTGVEAGQLAVIALALAAVGWWRRADAGRYRRWVVVPASLLIAIVGAWWTIARTLG